MWDDFWLRFVTLRPMLSAKDPFVEMTDVVRFRKVER